MCTGLNEYCPKDFSGYIWYLDNMDIMQKILSGCVSAYNTHGAQSSCCSRHDRKFRLCDNITKIATLDVSNIIKVII